MPTPTSPRASLSLAELVSARLAALEATFRVRPDQVVQTYGMVAFADAERHLKAPCVGAVIIGDDFSPAIAPDTDEVVVQQTHTATIAVICVVQTLNDPGGRKGRIEDRLTPLVTGTREVLLGWAPEGAFVGREVVRTDATVRALLGIDSDALAAPASRWKPLVLRRGRLAGIDGSRAWWQDEYTTHRLIRGAPTDIAPTMVPDTLCVGIGGDPQVPIEEVA